MIDFQNQNSSYGDIETGWNGTKNQRNSGQKIRMHQV